MGTWSKKTLKQIQSATESKTVESRVNPKTSIPIPLRQSKGLSTSLPNTWKIPTIASASRNLNATKGTNHWKDKTHFGRTLSFLSS